MPGGQNLMPSSLSGMFRAMKTQILLLAIVVTACTTLVSSKIPKSAMSKVKVGMTHAQLETLLGDPTGSEFLEGNETWHYKAWEDDGSDPDTRRWESGKKMIWYSVVFSGDKVKKVLADVENPDTRAHDVGVAKGKKSVGDFAGVATKDSPKATAPGTCYSRTKPPSLAPGCRLTCVNDAWSSVCK